MGGRGCSGRARCIWLLALVCVHHTVATIAVAVIAPRTAAVAACRELPAEYRRLDRRLRVRRWVLER